METIELKKQKNNIANNYQNYSIINKNDFSTNKILKLTQEEFKELSTSEQAQYVDRMLDADSELTMDDIVNICKVCRNEK